LVLVTEDDPLYVKQFFDVFFQEYPRDSIEILGVTILRAFHEPLTKTAKRVFKFYGPLDFLRVLPRFLLSKLAGRTISKLALEHGLPLITTPSINSEDFINKIKALGPELIVSVAAPEIFKSRVLSLASIGCLNIHSGKIPDYRGMMPTFWQMLEGQKNVTVSVHEMVEKLDSGGIIDTFEFPIKPGDSLDRVISGTKQEGARLMIRILKEIAVTRAMPKSTPLIMENSRLFKFPQPSDVKKFRALGFRML